MVTSAVCADGVLTVIYDGGHTEPIAPYLKILNEPQEDDTREVVPEPSLGAADLKQLLPIHSPDLSPGRVPTVAVSRPFATPLFMLGSDPLSLRWLGARRAQLQKLGAIGLLVEVPDKAALQRVLAAAGDLSLIPASGSDLARSLELTHYPVLITREGVSQ